MFKMGAAFVHSQSKTTTRQFRALFATISMQGKYVTMDEQLHSRVKLALSWVDSSRWKLPKVTKDTNISGQGFGLHILGCARYFVQLDELHFKLLPHSPYSPDLAPSNYWLIADLKRMLQGKRFGSNEEVISGMHKLFCSVRWIAF